MTGMWFRWAARRRLAGLAFLGGAAVALAAAVLLLTIGDSMPASFLLGFGASLVIGGVYQFATAAYVARLGR